ncbi:glycosyltransferase, partial [Patescibacteria group bacterium]
MTKNLPKIERSDYQRDKALLRAVLELVIASPGLSISKLLRKVNLIYKESSFSWDTLKRLLVSLKVETKRRRRLFSRWSAKISFDTLMELMQKLVGLGVRLDWGPKERLEAVRLVDEGVPVSTVTRAYKISRPCFYKWSRRYHQASSGKEYQAVSDQRRLIKRYWRQATKKQVEIILKVVVEHPEYSTHRIADVLKRKLGEFALGNHGVQNVLRRNSLNTFSSRLAYAQSQQGPRSAAPVWVGRLKKVLGQIPGFSALPPPGKFSRERFFKVLGYSTVSSTIFFTASSFWLGMISQASSLVIKVGLFFASVALLMGTFFFIYSMKYYLSLAFVLSFSRRREDKERERPVAAGKVGFWNLLGKVIGIDISFAKQEKKKKDLPIINSREKQPFGLESDLSSVSLKRYPFISVQLPMFNEKRVAERLLKACAQMNYPNFEVLVCDDSTDETTAIVERFARQWNAKIKSQKSNLKNQNLDSRQGIKNYSSGPRIRVLHRSTRAGFKGAALG